jgi:PAS domain S-box-containing protein
VSDFYERLLAFTQDAVYRYGYDDGLILQANQGLVDVLGLTCKPEELVGRHLRELLVYTEKEGVVRQAIARSGEVHGLEYHFQTLSGDQRWVIHDSFISTDPVTGGKVVEAIAKDITVRKRAELSLQQLNEQLELRVQQRTAELETVNRELESFAYSVSHDLRAPLRHVDSFSKILLDEYPEKLDEQGRFYLGRIRENTQRLALLIDQLLALSRLTRSEVRALPVNLSALASEVMRELQQAEPARKVEFTLAPDLTAHADPALMRTVLYNLLGNAWKFTSQLPSATIEFGAERRGDGLEYYVRDNGAGFDMAYVDKLFTPFQRLHRAPAFPGNGIGLVSVLRIVSKHGGKIWAEARVGQGATFRFTLGRGLEQNDRPGRDTP